MVDHYDVLGVPSHASPEQIRRAYLERARKLHPDHSPSGGAPTGRAMQDVNEAWRVLRDPGRRSAYDARLAAARATPRSDQVTAPRAPGRGVDGVHPDDMPYQHARAQPGDVGVAIVRGLPWVAVLAVLLAIFVFTAFAGGGADDERPSSYDLVGHCVQLRQGLGAVEVPCAGPNEGRVDLVVNKASQCPSGSVAAPADGVWLCLRSTGD